MYIFAISNLGLLRGNKTPWDCSFESSHYLGPGS